MVQKAEVKTVQNCCLRDLKLQVQSLCLNIDRECGLNSNSLKKHNACTAVLPGVQLL